MKGLSKKSAVLLCTLVLLAQNCAERVKSPTSVDPNGFPSSPTNLKAFIGDGVVILSWLHNDLSSIISFNIYRADSSTTGFSKIGLSDSMTYRDRSLQNNREYFYQVTAVGSNGLESSKSATASAVPAVYGISINFGREFTTSQTVTLSFTAPPTTSLVKISNDSLFSSSQWEGYVPIKTWNLSFEDGEKTVYAKFRDALDRETFEAFSDLIIFDTQALIRRVTEDSGGRVLTGGDSVHFSVETDEPKGQAWVVLSRVLTRIDLFDNGTEGDLVADDGIYEADYRLPSGRSSEAENIVVAGHFIDRAGNFAATVQAAGKITIRRAPISVDLISVSPVVSDSTELNIFWTRNIDDDFANYRIFRLTSPGVDTSSPLVTIIQDQTATSHTDTTLGSNTTYYYRVYVFDTTGLSSGSNEVSGTTNP